MALRVEAELTLNDAGFTAAMKEAARQMQGLRDVAIEAGATMSRMASAQQEATQAMADSNRQTQEMARSMTDAVNALATASAAIAKLGADSKGGIGDSIQSLVEWTQTGLDVVDLVKTMTPHMGSLGAAITRAGTRMLALAAAGAPVIAVVVAIGAAIGAAYKAFSDYNQSVQAVDRANKMAVVSIGMTRGALEEQAAASAEQAGISIKAARDQQAAYIATGKISGEIMGKMIGISRDYALATGQDSKEATASLARLFSDPAKGADELANSMGLLDAATLANIKNLADMGKETEAQGLLLDALAKRAKEGAGEMTLLGRAAEAVSTSLANVWDWMGKKVGQLLGEQVSPEEQLKDAQKAREDIAAELKDWQDNRRTEPFARINIASLTKNLAEAEALVSQHQAKVDKIAKEAADRRALQDAQQGGREAMALLDRLDTVAARKKELDTQINTLKKGLVENANVGDGNDKRLQEQIARLEGAKNSLMTDQEKSAMRAEAEAKATTMSAEAHEQLMASVRAKIELSGKALTDDERQVEIGKAVAQVTKRQADAHRDQAEALRDKAKALRDQQTEQRQAVEAEKRRADAAGKGEAAMRAAEIENQVAPVRERDKAAGDALEKSLKEKEAAQVRGMANEAIADMDKQIQANNDLAASLEAGAEAATEMTVAQFRLFAESKYGPAAAADVNRAVEAYERLQASGAKLDDVRKKIAQNAAAEKAKAEAEAAVAKTAGELTDAIYNQLTGKGDSIVGWFKNLFKTIAAEAVKSRIILPIATAVVGSMPSLFGLGIGDEKDENGKPTGKPTMSGLLEMANGGGLAKLVEGMDKMTAKLGDLFSGGLDGLFGKGGLSSGGEKLRAAMFGGEGTSGLFGSGGTLFGSANAAIGVSGALSGIGTGMMAGSVMGMLGIGKGNSTGSAIGGALGGAIGSFVPGVGTLLGSIAGGALGSLFGSKPSNKEGSAMIDLNSGNYQIGGFTGKKYSQENRDTAGSIADKVLSIKDALEKQLGAQIKGSIAVGAGSRDGLFATSLNSSTRTSFDSSEAGMKQLISYVTQQFVTGIQDQLAPEISAALGRVNFSDMEKAGADIDFITGFRDSLKSLKGDMGLVDQATAQASAQVKEQVNAIRAFHDTAARLFPDAMGEVDSTLRSYVDGLIGVREAAPAMTELESAMAVLEAKWKAYIPLMTEVGYSTAEAQQLMADGLAKAKEGAKGDWVAGMDREFNSLTGNDYINKVRDLKTNRDTQYRNADALGADRKLVDRNTNAALKGVLENANLRPDQLQEAIRLFGTDFPEAASIAQGALDKLTGSVTDTGKAAATAAATKEALEGLKDRMAKADGSADTQAGALDMFDRARARELESVRERIKAGEIGAEVLTRTEEVLGAERVALAKSYADKAKAIDTGLADREFALANAGSKDEQINALKRKQKTEYDAAVAAGYTADQLVRLANVLDGELKQAIGNATKSANDNIDERLFNASTDSNTLEGALAAFDRKTKKEREELVKISGANLGDFDKATHLERGGIQKQFDLKNKAINDGLADRKFAVDNAGSVDEQINALKRKQKAEYDAAVAAGYTSDQLTNLSLVLSGELAQAIDQAKKAVNDGIADRLFNARTDTNTQEGALAAFDRQAAKDLEIAGKNSGANLNDLKTAIGLDRNKIVDQFKKKSDDIFAGFADRQFALDNAGSTDEQINALKHKQEAELKAAKAAGYTEDQMSGLARVLSGELAQAIDQAKKAVNDNIANRLFNAETDTSKLPGALAAFDRQAAKDRKEAAKTSGADLVSLEKAIGLEREKIVDQFKKKSEEINAGLADREFALDNAGSTDEQITALKRKRDIELKAAEAAGYSREQLQRLANVLDREVAQAANQAAKAINDRTDDRLFNAQTDTSQLAGALAAFNRQADKDILEAKKTSGADILKLERAIGLERAKLIKQFVDRDLAALNQAGGTLRQWVDSVRAGNSTPAVNRDMAQRQFDQQMVLAKGGNLEAIQGLRDYAQRLIDAQTPYTASGADRRAMVEGILSQIEALPAVKSYDQQILDELKGLKDGIKVGIDLTVIRTITEALNALTDEERGQLIKAEDVIRAIEEKLKRPLSKEELDELVEGGVIASWVEQTLKRPLTNEERSALLKAGSVEQKIEQTLKRPLTAEEAALLIHGGLIARTVEQEVKDATGRNLLLAAEEITRTIEQVVAKAKLAEGAALLATEAVTRTIEQVVAKAKLAEGAALLATEAVTRTIEQVVAKAKLAEGAALLATEKVTRTIEQQVTLQGALLDATNANAKIALTVGEVEFKGQSIANRYLAAIAWNTASLIGKDGGGLQITAGPGTYGYEPQKNYEGPAAKLNVGTAANSNSAYDGSNVVTAISNLQTWQDQVWTVLRGYFTGSSGIFLDKIRHNTAETVKMLGGTPGYDTGTDNHPGGWAYVHQDEFVRLPGGSQVFTKAETLELARLSARRPRLAEGKAGSGVDHARLAAAIDRQAQAVERQNALLEKIAANTADGADAAAQTAAIVSKPARVKVGTIATLRRAG
ncbi:hypothetical protein GE253_19480 [Niveispirillum sp. SYP-B3756]|uniref:phage tail length tape measure family protein n=1 Tax=Niveispirillum sp. SYP-B3756 TaxID=2662178 RepID=UPI0012914000|nr:phage tail length tape measure family protein [Niveispirillum sp. SYP-B3756]MQP67512.1 hypothetical protein [Niveispirillum sp. SYP-B3756]